MKRAFIIYGWDGRPDNGWYPWLKKELEVNGFEAQIPLMPNADVPTIEEWVPFLKNVVGKLDTDTHFICHSIGCQTLLRLLEKEDDNVKIGGVLFVAPWMHLENLEDAESEAIARPWIETPVQWDKVRLHLGKLLCIFSTDDPWVPLSDAKIFEGSLGAQTMIFENQDHFVGTTLPISIDKILELFSPSTD